MSDPKPAQPRKPQGSEVVPGVYLSSNVGGPPGPPPLSPNQETLRRYEAMGMRAHCLRRTRRPGGGRRFLGG